MKIGEMEPHVFAISDNAYYYMRRDKKNQVRLLFHAFSRQAAV